MLETSDSSRHLPSEDPTHLDPTARSCSVMQSIKKTLQKKKLNENCQVVNIIGALD